MEYKRSPVVKIDHMIQAQPNFFILDLLQSGEVKKTPVVAWGISNNIIHPVTINEIRGRNPTILAPNGEIFTLEDTWPSLEAWEADVRERIPGK